MATKNVVQNTLADRSSSHRMHFGIGDGGSANPGALFVTVHFADDQGNHYQWTTWLETSDRDGNGNLLGTYTNAAISGFTSAQITTLKSQLIALIHLAQAGNSFV